MLVAADHEIRTRTPPAVLVEMPLSLDSLHGCATFVAGRRGSRDELCSGHSVPRLRGWVRPKFTRVVLHRNPSGFAGGFGVVRRLLNGPFVHRSRVRLWTQRAALRRPLQQTSVVLG